MKHLSPTSIHKAQKVFLILLKWMSWLPCYRKSELGQSREKLIWKNWVNAEPIKEDGTRSLEKDQACSCALESRLVKA